MPEADGHRVWWCEGGAADGVPVLIVHGGPGGSSRVEPTRWFDGLPVRWIAIDQRGCGRSTPRAETAHNDLPALLRDMERLRAHLGLTRWAVAGGSWGARVALALAHHRPETVQGLLLRSPFLGSAGETQRYIEAWPRWLGETGRRFVGEASAEGLAELYRAATPLLSHGAIERLMTGPLAQAWAAYDDAQSAPGGIDATHAAFDPARLAQVDDALAAWRVHSHYAASGWGAGGLAAGWPLCDGAAVVSAGPVHAVWGAADATCDPAVARALIPRLPRAIWHEVPGAGHRMNDPRLAPVLREAARAWVSALS